MQPKVLWGYAHGRSEAWEAICIDLDIAVQGASFDDVRNMLTDAVATYFQDAFKEAPKDHDRLLKRRAPLWIKIKFAAVFIAHINSSRRNANELQAGFDIPCPA